MADNKDDEVKPDQPRFDDVVVARDTITKKQEREIRKFYNQVAREIREMEKSLPDTPYNETQRRHLVEMYYQLRSASIQLTTEINTSVTNNVEWMGKTVQRVNVRWLESVGLTPESLNRKFSQSTDSAIRSILTGNLYGSGSLNLSSKIWNITDGNLTDMNSIIAKGLAEGRSLNSIAKELERYINPDMKNEWRIITIKNPDGTTSVYRIRNNQPDYKARRLARTSIQHAYQQTMIALTKDNPFVKGYVWHADGRHPCELCESRDNEFFTADEVPLDHPNGQCSIEPSLDYGLIDKSIDDGRLTWEAYDEMLDFFGDLDFREGITR